MKVKPMAGGGITVLAATAMAGFLGYVITILVANYLADDYVRFAAFWALLYLLVGGFSGVQQEIARGTLPPSNVIAKRGGAGANPWFVATVVSGFAILVAGIISVGLGPLAFGPNWIELAFPLVVGLGLNIFLVAGMGTLYGLASWKQLGLLIFGDVSLRLLLIIVGIHYQLNLVSLAWLVVAPYGILVVIFVAFSRREVRSGVLLDVSSRTAIRNVSKTLLASCSIAFLVSGVPLAISTMASSTDQLRVSSLIFGLVLTRAPLVVGVLAMQSFLVVFFRQVGGEPARRVSKIVLLLAAFAFIFALIAWLVGSPIISWLSGSNFILTADIVGWLTLSALPTAVLAVISSRELARNRHDLYSGAWVVSAVAAMLMLALPIEIEWRVVVALGIGPMIGASIPFIFRTKALKI